MTELERQEHEKEIREQIRMEQRAYKRAWNAANRDKIKAYNRKQYLKRVQEKRKAGGQS